MSGSFGGLGHSPGRSGWGVNRGLGEIPNTGRGETVKPRSRLERGWCVCSAPPGGQGVCS